MGRIEVKDEHEAHIRIGREGTQDLAESLHAAGRGTDTDDGELRPGSPRGLGGDLHRRRSWRARGAFG